MQRLLQTTSVHLHVKSTDSHQYLQSSWCNLLHYKKGIPYNQTSRLDFIYSQNNSFDKRCKDLEYFSGIQF